MTTTSRPDIYAKVHRGLRASLFNLSTLIGRTDFMNDQEVGALRAGAHEVLHFLDEHARNEERWILSLLESKVAGASGHDHESHERIEAEINTFASALNEVASMPASPERCAAGEMLYHRFNRFVSGYILHMEEEEVATTAMLYAYCTDDELQGITRNIMANSEPRDVEMALRAFLPAIDRRLRGEFVHDIARSAPAPVVEWVLGIARETLATRDYEDLAGSMVQPTLDNHA